MNQNNGVKILYYATSGSVECGHLHLSYVAALRCAAHVLSITRGPEPWQTSPDTKPEELVRSFTSGV